MFCSKMDPIIDDALKKGCISGPIEELQTLVELLNIICNHSDIAQSVIHEALSLGSKIIISDEINGLGLYRHGLDHIYFNKSIFHNIKSDIQQILVADILVHEARHACQYSLPEKSKDNIHIHGNWANIIIGTCLSEADAQTIGMASMYQLVESFGINNDNTRYIFSERTKNMYGHFMNEYEKHHDMLKTFKFVSRMSSWKHSDYYKSLSIKELGSHLKYDSVVIHPNEWVRLLNLTYKNTPYMDIRIMARRALCLRAEDYEQLKQKLEKEQKKDDSLEYFSIKVPKECEDNTKNKYEIIPAKKHFLF